MISRAVLKTATKEISVVNSPIKLTGALVSGTVFLYSLFSYILSLVTVDNDLKPSIFDILMLIIVFSLAAHMRNIQECDGLLVPDKIFSSILVVLSRMAVLNILIIIVFLLYNKIIMSKTDLPINIKAIVYSLTLMMSINSAYFYLFGIRKGIFFKKYKR